jgi:hypothetical protein
MFQKIFKKSGKTPRGESEVTPIADRNCRTPTLVNESNADEPTIPEAEPGSNFTLRKRHANAATPTKAPTDTWTIRSGVPFRKGTPSNRAGKVRHGFAHLKHLLLKMIWLPCRRRYGCGAEEVITDV